MPRTHPASFFATELTLEMGPNDLDASVFTTADGPTSPCYIVIDPLETSRREIIYADGTFDGTTFRTTALSNRYLAGSAAGSGITHPVGATVWSSPVAQDLDQLWDYIETNESTWSATVPVGGIIMWSGVVGNIPANWQLADGTNGTPDLRGRFIVGAGGTYSTGDTGGSSTHTHSGPSHTHSFSDTSSFTGAHTHDTNVSSDTSNRGVAGGGEVVAPASHDHLNTGSAGAHNHTVSGTTGSGGTGSTGSSGTLPPYYALAFIQRMS